MSQIAQILVNAIISGSLYALAAAGLTLTYGLFRLLNFAHGHMMMLGAYLFLSCHDYLANLPIIVAQESSLSTQLLAFLLALLLTVPAAAIVLNLFLLPFAKHNLVLTLVATLGLSIILESLVSLVFGPNIRSLDAGALSTVHVVDGVYITSLQALIILSAIFVFAAMGVLLQFTGAGRALRALATNPEGAESLGVDRSLWMWRTFAISMCVTTFAGILAAYETTLQPTMGSSYTVKAFAAMIVGGLGNIWGTVAGAYLLGIIENFAIGLDLGSWSLPAGYKDAFAYFFILIVLLFRPQGLFGGKARSV